MATKAALKKVSNTITRLTDAVSNTFIEQAHLIAAACSQAFGGSLDIDAADLTAIQDVCEQDSTWNGSTSAGVRRSEIKSIVLAYTGLETGAKVFKREFGELRRNHFLKVARMIPEYETASDAALDSVLFFEERDAKANDPKTSAEKLAAALKQALANTKGSKMNIDLKAFIKKYKIVI